MDNVSGGNGLGDYVKSVTGEDKVKREVATVEQEVKVDPKVLEKLMNEIKAQTEEVLKKTQELYALKSEKKLGDFLIEFETAANKIL